MPVKIGAARSARRVLAPTQAVSSRSNVKAGIAAPRTTKTSFEALAVPVFRGAERLIPVGGYGLLVVLQILLVTSAVGNKLFNLGLQLSGTFGQVL